MVLRCAASQPIKGACSNFLTARDGELDELRAFIAVPMNILPNPLALISSWLVSSRLLKRCDLLLENEVVLDQLSSSPGSGLPIMLGNG